ncbi:metal-dependent hydrolase [Citricoccus sp. K5]|uniref:metal-dependent hydrolase n=1 Tax=Citricoccus sp. K5 TaxID=2653135 RepID=UPI0012F0DA6C|nr:metal-dependent hydrolase [Citricoccus sp. K5]VXC08765.1 putative LexA-binding, inner membrane-associated hydrolase [Citricoccus sp. K5]
MMGPHHAACGAAGWVLIAADYAVPLGPLAGVGLLGTSSAVVLPEAIPLGFGLLPGITDLGILTGAIVAAGAALLPDADHRSASIAHSLPPVSEWICAAVGRVAGGHRNGTHSLLGLAAFTLIAWLLSLLAMPTTTGTVQVGAGLGTVLLASFAVKALKFMPDRARKVPWLVAVPLGALAAFGSGDQGFWFVLAVALGVAVHIAGDMLTDGGCNPFWPLKLRPPSTLPRTPLTRALWSSGGRMKLPVLGPTGSRREWAVAVVVSLVAVAGMVAALMGVLTDGARLLARW